MVAKILRQAQDRMGLRSELEKVERLNLFRIAVKVEPYYVHKRQKNPPLLCSSLGGLLELCRSHDSRNVVHYYCDAAAFPDWQPWDHAGFCTPLPRYGRIG